MNLIETHWEKFRDSLKGKLEAADKADLKNAWNSQAERTEFYTSKLLPQVAEDPMLKIDYELCNFDFALCAKSTSGHMVPLIFKRIRKQRQFGNSRDAEVVQPFSPSQSLNILY